MNASHDNAPVFNEMEDVEAEGGVECRAGPRRRVRRRDLEFDVAGAFGMRLLTGNRDHLL